MCGNKKIRRKHASASCNESNSITGTANVSSSTTTIEKQQILQGESHRKFERERLEEQCRAKSGRAKRSNGNDEDCVDDSIGSKTPILGYTKSKECLLSTKDGATSESPPSKRPRVQEKCNSDLRKEQNRKAAIISRGRKKILIDELQKSVAVKTSINTELEETNAHLQRLLKEAQLHVQRMEAERYSNEEHNFKNDNMKKCAISTTTSATKQQNFVDEIDHKAIASSMSHNPVPSGLLYLPTNSAEMGSMINFPPVASLNTGADAGLRSAATLNQVPVLPPSTSATGTHRQSLLPYDASPFINRNWLLGSGSHLTSGNEILSQSPRESRTESMVSCISTPTLRNLQHLATFSGSEIQQTIPTVSNALLGLSETVLSYQTATVTTADRARELVALQQQLNLLPFILQQQQQMSLQQPEHQLQLHRALLQRQLMIASHPSIQNDTNSQMLRQQEQHQQQQRDYRLLQNLALDGTALQQQQPAETVQQSEIEQLLKKYRQQNQDDYQ